ncbi:MAG: FAD/FMN-containing dehydrogenase [Myxococcota bacterium]
MTHLLRPVALLGLVGLGIACASDPPPAKPLTVGARLAPATLLDQNEVPHQIDESIRIIFFAREMEGGAVIRAVLDEEGPDYLEQHRALYVADISGMPAVIARLIAIPKMQKERPYPTLLDRDGTTTAPFPAEEGRVTVMALDELRVTAIDYRDSPAGVREAVAKTR